MKITALKQQVKNPERVSVFVDEKYAFSLSLGEVVTHKVRNGLELSETDLKKYKKISEDGKLSVRALEWVLNRPRSIREFSDYMRRKKVESELAEKLTEDFLTKKYLDDEAYARWLVELRSRAGKSNRAIRSELFAKGVGREVADSVLEEASDETERLRELIAKKSKLSRYQSDQLKFAKYLTGQGFSYDQVKKELGL